MNKIQVGVKKLHKDAVIPKYAHDTDTGFDLFTVEDLWLEPHGKGIAKTGLAFELPQGWGVQVRNKSGMTIKGVPAFTNSFEWDDVHKIFKEDVCYDREDVTVYLGTIDESYRGEIGIMVKNEEDYPVVIPKGTKLAQGVLEKVYHCDFVEVEDLSKTDRGEGGYGSTGSTINE